MYGYYFYILMFSPLVFIAGILLLLGIYFLTGMSVLDVFFSIGKRSADLTCWHCKQETSADRKTCQHCGEELQ